MSCPYTGVALTSWYFSYKKKTKNKRTRTKVRENRSLNMSALLFFGNNSFQKHLVGETQNGCLTCFFFCEELNPPTVETLHFSEQLQHFSFFCPLNLSCLQQVMVKTSPFNSWAGARSSQSHTNNKSEAIVEAAQALKRHWHWHTIWYNSHAVIQLGQHDPWGNN